MRISELVARLEEIRSREGDLLVDLSADYDCGYCQAGGDVDEISVGEVDRWSRDASTVSGFRRDHIRAVILHADEAYV